MDAKGYLRKMRVEPDSPVRYTLELGEQTIDMNPLVGGALSLTHTGNIVCINCERKTKKSFSQGYCYPCFRRLAECDTCIMSPEKCHFHEGTCRDPEWGKAFCMQPHYVYLSNSSAVKVGITREGQLPVRWIDQGAIQGMPVLKTESRQLAGFAEDAVREFISDRTQWQTMLKGKIPELDLVAEWEELLPRVQTKLDELKATHGKDSIQILEEQDVTQIAFPVQQHPEKVKSLNFDKTPDIAGTLLGIKGQYLILDTGVLNIRKFTAYEIELTIG